MNSSKIYKSKIRKCTLYILLITIWGCKNSTFQYGKSEIQLSNLAFDIDVPAFLADEKLFDWSNYGLGLRVFENTMYGPNDSTIHYIQYSNNLIDSDFKPAKYNNFKFDYLEFITDIEEKEVWVWMATQDSASKEEITSLLDDIIKSNSETTISYKDLENRWNNELKMVWRTKDRVIKLVIPNLTGIELDSQNESNYEYDENGYLIEIQKEPHTKEVLLNEFKKKLEAASDNNEVILFISNPQFDKMFKEGNQRSSGTMTKYN